MQRHADVTALDVEPPAVHRLRDGLDATLVFPGGAALRVLVVHLKTGCHRDRLAASRRPQCALLARQIPVVAGWIAGAGGGTGVRSPCSGISTASWMRSEEMTSGVQCGRGAAGAGDGGAERSVLGRRQSFIDTMFLGGARRAAG